MIADPRARFAERWRIRYGFTLGAAVAYDTLRYIAEIEGRPAWDQGGRYR